LYVPTEGPITLFEYPQSAHVSDWLETIDEVRPSRIVWSSVRGADGETAAPFATEIADLVRRHGGGDRRVGLDRCFLSLARALEREGCEVFDCNQDVLWARRIKTAEELECLRVSMAASEAAVRDLERAVEPGVTEQELFAAMYGSVIARGGEMIETRLVSSGPRTNPWFQEASEKIVRPGELVAVDTDTIGCHGYYSDFSRTFLCGDGEASGEQMTLYRLAAEQVRHNTEILGPGMTYREVAEKAWPVPDRYVDRRYTSIVHGCGMHGEAPFIPHLRDFDDHGGGGVLEPGMVLCVESFVGAAGGGEGVKLEEEVVVTETGTEPISRYPLDDRLLDPAV
jgi:Xaa-Pro aminopeptidase